MTKQKTPSLVTIGILTVITVTFWIIFGVVRVFKGEAKSVEIPAAVIAPLTPTLDNKAVDKLRQRIYFDKGMYFETVVPTPVATETTVTEEESL